MGKLNILFFCLFASTAVMAAGDTTFKYVVEKTIIGNFTNFYTDNFGNIFLLSKNNQVKKLNAQYDSAGVFNDVRRYGDISLLDVSNPMKIAVYYKDFSTLLIADRFLNIRNTIDLRNAGILQAKAVAQSYDNNYWVFDELDNALKKIDDKGNILLQSPDFRILLQEAFRPTCIIDAESQLYICDENKGCLVFDYYGTYKKLIPFTARQNIQIANGTINSTDSSFFFTYNMATFNETKITIPIAITGAVKVQMAMNKLYVLTQNGLTIYSAGK